MRRAHLSLARLTQVRMPRALVKDLPTAERRFVLAHTPPPGKRARRDHRARGGCTPAERMRPGKKSIAGITAFKNPGERT